MLQPQLHFILVGFSEEGQGEKENVVSSFFKSVVYMGIQPRLL